MDVLWILIAAALVFLMQAGFLCLESGLVRSKNSINVAAKNIADFALSGAIFWAVGFGLMFGESVSGWFGWGGFFFDADASARDVAVFIFQLMFCGTAVTLVSGAVAERLSFFSYLLVATLISFLIYPVVGHWVWGGVVTGEPAGWLEKMGFVDFAGSTVVHSVGGWVALAAILIIGPRQGRFDVNGRRIPGSNIPMAVLGGMLIWFGWFGFNGGSTLAWTDQVPGILLNTFLASFLGGIAATALKYWQDRYVDVTQMINGVLGGLVAVTANCHVVTPSSAALIGLVGGLIVTLADRGMERMRIDDAIGAVPVHLAAGIWGTLAVALFADLSKLGTGLSRTAQFQVQLTGVVVVGLSAFCVAYLALRWLNLLRPLRVSPKAELVGLNVVEHRVTTEVFDLLSAMQHQQSESDFSTRVPVEPFTEVGQIAQQYNRVIDKVNQEIQQRDEAFSAFRESEYRKGAILDAAMDCIVSIDSRGDVQEFNPAAEQCFGVGKDHVVNRNFFKWFMPADERKIAYESLSQGFTLSEGLVLKRQNVTQLQRYDHETFPAEVVVTLTTDKNSSKPEYTLHIRDITKQIKLQNRLKLMAFNDPLTGLYNRTYFMGNLSKRIDYHRDNPGTVALLFLDLDQFKKINDTLGHKAGDALLCEIASRLSAVTRDMDLVGRWGGDEFVVVMSGDLNVQDVCQRAEEILAAMREPVALEGQNLTVLTSIGIALSENGDVDSDRLLQHADMAMYNAKHAGRNTYRVFSDDMAQAAHQQFHLEVALPEAIKQNQFFLHYQPKVDCKTQRVVGFEALLRWEHPENGLIPPVDFIPVIDGSALIIDVGEWVIKETIEQLVAWREAGLPMLPVAINISGHHLQSETLLPYITQLTQAHDIAHDLLELEITEGVITGDTEGSIKAMAALREAGIRIAIDDFGTGYSSLSYLKRFPVDVLKIDRSFVNECAHNREDAAICEAIITLAKSLRLTIVAEGVETDGQLSFLRHLDCDVYQGYLFSRPVSPAKVQLMLENLNVA